MRRVLACLASWFFLAGAHAAAASEPLEVRLEPQGGRTHFTLGEPITLDLVITAHKPGFSVNALKGGVSEQINVAPAKGWFRAHGIDGYDVVMPVPIKGTPMRQPVLLNPVVVFQQPGRYEVSVTTHVEYQGKSLERRSNSVAIELSAPDEAEEEALVKTLQTQIKVGLPMQKMTAAARRLAFLGGDAAIRAKVSFLFAEPCDCPDERHEIERGLASSRNLALQLELLHAAWLDTGRVPGADLLRAMHNTRSYMRGEMIEGWQMIIEHKTDLASLRAEHEDAANVEELIASLPQRSDENQALTAYLLMDSLTLTQEQELRMAPYVAKTFAAVDPFRRRVLLSSRWSKYLPQYAPTAR